MPPFRAVLEDDSADSVQDHHRVVLGEEFSNSGSGGAAAPGGASPATFDREGSDAAMLMRETYPRSGRR